ncbi:Lysophospholipase 1 [Venturia effusa]|uniref:Lysophospholipase n=1 Tax=Venturia effusa TaxID=50376 RepID=A0A517LBU4_9PEZI|nr:Lysophospholipase 1 [Venturia effusa]
MKTFASLALAASLAAVKQVAALEAKDVYMDVLETYGGIAGRALSNSPNGYTPSRVDCPSDRPSVRAAGQLSSNEASWLERRRNVTVDPMKTLLNRMNVTGFDVDSWFNDHANNASALPNIGIALSGGGWRALLNGAGVIQAMDSRTTNNSGAGQLGGLLQSATYLSGLSGGSWTVGSMYVNNFSSIQALRDTTSGSVYEFGNSILEGPDTGGLQILNTVQYYTRLADDVNGKGDAGFGTSLTDVWGRALSFQLINATYGGPGYTWSSIALDQDFADGNQPLPIIIADGRRPGELLIASNTTIFEFNPWEFGTWDPTIYGFVPMQYLGTNFTNGNVTGNDQCVVGFDNAGFVMGTSSSLFNQFLLQINQTGIPDALKNVLSRALGVLGEDNNDIAEYSPNPFFGYNPATNAGANFTALDLVDGGSNGENIPLHPLIQPNRGVDVIFAVDSSADTTYFWPNATSLVATYERSLGNIANGTNFPPIPDQNTIVNLGLNTRPTFFGCNASNMTDGLSTPLVVYIPNYPYITLSNFSTFQLSTNNSQRDAMIQNGALAATMNNNTRLSTCYGCAILSRSMEKTSTRVPDVCTSCFTEYCWNGTLDSRTPASYEPTTQLAGAKLSAGVRMSIGPVWISIFVFGITAIMTL